MQEYLKHVRLTAAMQLIYTHSKGDDLKAAEVAEEAAEDAKHAEEKSADRVAEEKEAMEAEAKEKEGDGVKDNRKKSSRLWIGEHDCMNIDNLKELGTTHVICLLKSEEEGDLPEGLVMDKRSKAIKEIKGGEDSKADKARDKFHGDLSSSYFHPGGISQKISEKKKEELDFQLFSLVLDLDDDDRGEESWKVFQTHMVRLVEAITEAMNIEASSLLIVDESGDSLSPAIFCCYMLLKKQIRVEVAVGATI